MNGHFWSRRDEKLLRSIYPWLPTEEIADVLGRTIASVNAHAGNLGLRKSAAYLEDKRKAEGARLKVSGVAHRFVKGSVPQNKGVRRPGWHVGRMRETQFKKGNRSGAAARNWCPIGTIRPDNEGFLRIKVREGKKGEAYGFGNVRIWPLLNRYVWQQHKGPIPDGHIVAFKDRNRANCVIENLELLSLADNMRRNSIHKMLAPELKQVIQLNGALKRKIRRRGGKLNGEEHIAGSARSPVRDAGIAV